MEYVCTLTNNDIVLYCSVEKEVLMAVEACIGFIGRALGIDSQRYSSVCVVL